MRYLTTRLGKMLLGLALALVLAVTPMAGAFADEAMSYEGKVRIGAHRANEGVVLGWLAKLLIDEYSSLKTEVIVFNASTMLHQAMVSEELDLYGNWTGTQLAGVLRYDGPKLSPEESYRYVKENFEKHFGHTWAKPLGFNNTYAMAVRRETAEKYDLKKASDLAPYAAGWKLGCDENFDTRPDTYPGWSEAYGIEFKEIVPMLYSIIYQAIDNEEVEVIAAYSTDSRIPKLDLVMLEDDKGWFPDYSAAYVIDMKLLDRYPRVLAILEQLSGTIDEETMGRLNGRYDDGDEPEDIARDYLVSVGLIGS